MSGNTNQKYKYWFNAVKVGEMSQIFDDVSIIYVHVSVSLLVTIWLIYLLKSRISCTSIINYDCLHSYSSEYHDYDYESTMHSLYTK